jgi:hypothetical protein
VWESLLLFFQSPPAGGDIPWTELLTYGPAGIVSAAGMYVLKVLVEVQKEKNKLAAERQKSLDDTNVFMVNRLADRDKAHEGALQKIVDSLDRVAERLDGLAQEQVRSSTLLAALARLVITPDGKRITEKEMRELVKSIYTEQPRRPA